MTHRTDADRESPGSRVDRSRSSTDGTEALTPPIAASPPVGDATPTSVDDGCSEDCEVDENSGECRHAGPVGDARGEPTCECGHSRRDHDDGRKHCLLYVDRDGVEGYCECKKFAPVAPVEAEAQEEEPDNEANQPVSYEEVVARGRATAGALDTIATLRARVSQLEATLAAIRAITRRAERSGLAHGPLDEIRSVLHATPEPPA